MYRSRRLSDAMPSHGASDIPSFIQQPDSPSASSPSSIAALSHQTFLERLAGLPLVRAAVDRIQDTYEKTKDRHQFIRGVLETGEQTVTYSLTRAADVLTKTGLSQRLQKPLSLVDASARYVLDKVEDKLPVISKTPYEIKLMISDTVENRKEQLTDAKDSAVCLVKDLKARTTEFGTEKMESALETPIGQKFNQTLDGVLTVVDNIVERFLPEGGHSHKNGNGTANGHYAYTNGVHTGTLDHAKSLSRKFKRRFSAKTIDTVDAAQQKYPTFKKVVGIAETAQAAGKELVQKAKDYTGIVIGSAIDFGFTTTLFFVPGPFKAHFIAFFDGLTNKVVTFVKEHRE